MLHLPIWLSPDILAYTISSILLAVIAHAVKTPKDHERATLLVTLAADAAAIAVNLSPAASWTELLQQVVSRLKAADTGVGNDQAIERAATAALVRLGKTSAAK